MKIFKKSVFILLMLCAIFALFSCGDNKPADPDPQDPSGDPSGDPTDPQDPQDPTVEKFTVTFNTQGGSSVQAQEVEKGQFATKPADPTKADHNFTGWFKEAECQNEFNFATEAVVADLTVYAGWAEVVVEKFTVTFDSQEGSPVESQEVEKGQLATKPADPTKDNFSFLGWYKDAAGENPFDFDTETVVANITLYACWLDASSGDATTAKFFLNYEGAAEPFATKNYKDGGRIENPGNPTRDGYTFAGWFTEEGVKYANATKFTGNQEFYAKWLKVYTFEAEDTQLTGIEYSAELQGVVSLSGDKLGVNFSGNTSGKNLIREDANSSGGKFVWGCLNLEEGYLDFEFTADQSDDHAELTIVVSAEFWGFTLSPDMFKVLVNPEDNDDDSVEYDDIDLTFVETSQSSNLHPTWVKAYINEIQIQEGENLIRLYVDNNNSYGIGTITAQGPIVDCIIIESTSELVMTTYE